jgi:hypothetical protein
MGAGLWNRGNVMVGLYGMWQDAETPPPKGAAHLLGVHVNLGLITSNDGIHFREPVPGFQVISRGGEGEWDNVALLQGHAFVNEGDKTMIWYSHWDTGATLQSMDIGLATLRRDGFGYLSPKQDDSDAQFTTSTFTAKEVSVNLDGVSAETPVKVQLIDHLDRPMPGYEATLTQSGLHQRIAWPKPIPAGEQVAVRIHFPEHSTAKVYAIYLN